MARNQKISKKKAGHRRRKAERAREKRMVESLMLYPDIESFFVIIMSRRPDKPYFAGTFEECLDDWYRVMLETEKEHPDFPEQVLSEMELATGIGTRRQVWRWLEQEQSPRGENRVRLMFYLVCHGYEICELRHMPNFWDQFIMYVVLGDISWDKTAEFMGISKHKMFNMLSGDEPLMSEYARAMAHLLVLSHQRETAAILESICITMVDADWGQDAIDPDERRQGEEELQDCHRFLPQDVRKTKYPPHRLLRRKKRSRQ